MCAKWNSIGGLENIITIAAIKQITTFIHYTNAMLGSGAGDQSGVADVGLGNADLDLCCVWGHLGAGADGVARSGLPLSKPQSPIMVTSRVDVSDV